MSCEGTGLCRCGCCAGIDGVTPRPVWNAPGLGAIQWRVGEHADFFETLLNRLGSTAVDVETGAAGRHGRMQTIRTFPLRDLRTRERRDPTIALLDAWSVVGDVLTFYTERIANEGFLRTATELRSVLELARLVGYRRRPGVAASVFLAFIADDTWKNAEPIIVPAGARVQSMPDPESAPAAFETEARLSVRPEWNVLLPRRRRPLFLPLSLARDIPTLYFKGTTTNLAPNHVLVLDFGDGSNRQVFRIVKHVVPDFARDETRVDLMDGKEPPEIVRKDVSFDTLIRQLERRPSIPPRSPAHLALTVQQTFGRGSAASDAMLLAFHPMAARSLFKARANAAVTAPAELQTAYAMRVKAAVYANNAPPKMRVAQDGAIELDGDGEWPLVEARPVQGGPPPHRILDLDTTYDTIVPDSWVVIERFNGRRPIVAKVTDVQTVSRKDYNFPARVTRLILRRAWLDDDDTLLSQIQSTVVYAAPERLTVADVPVEEPVGGADIALDRQVDGLQPGRWLIVSGERSTGPADPEATEPQEADLSVSGVMETELVMIAGVRQDTLAVEGEQVLMTAPPEKARRLPGDTTHTFVQLATPLAYYYKRDTLTIHGNVAHATHGETRREALGSGDARQRFQTFALKSAPLTYVSSPNPSGIESTLRLYVNDARWHEAENLLDLGPTDRGFLTSADAEQQTQAITGDGVTGSRLPNGTENVRAVYRSGIGMSGNVRAGQISQLVANTSGLRSVTNPQPSSGGADAEGIMSARARAPLAVAALDRLVGTVDYADFARLYAGIAKATAARLPGAHGQVVQVTIAGEADIPIEVTSDLHRNLLASLERFGDPHLPVRLVRRELLLLVIAARISVHPDYEWDSVRPRVEAAMFEYFGFDRRRLGQDAYAAEAVAVMQAVTGVRYVDLDLFRAVSEVSSSQHLETLGETLTGVGDRIPAFADRLDPSLGDPRPAQLVILDRRQPTLLMLTEVPHD